MKRVGTVIKELRTKRMITQEQLAYALDISYQAVSKWERLENDPEIYKLPEIANFFNVSIDYLFEYKQTTEE